MVLLLQRDFYTVLSIMTKLSMFLEAALQQVQHSMTCGDLI